MNHTKGNLSLKLPRGREDLKKTKKAWSIPEEQKEKEGRKERRQIKPEKK